MKSTPSLAHTAVSVASGATLGGNGTLGGLTTSNSDAPFAPGNSPGTLTAKAGPEPATYAMLLGLAAVGFTAWRKKSSKLKHPSASEA